MGKNTKKTKRGHTPTAKVVGSYRRKVFMKNQTTTNAIRLYPQLKLALVVKV